MAFFWNPNALAEFDGTSLILRIPSSGFYARVAGPIVELLSQLPFDDVDEAVEIWQERCGRGDLTTQKASVVWHELCDQGAIFQSEFLESVNAPSPEEWVTIDGRIVDSHIHRFMDAQDFMADDDVVPMGA